jgi:hypothetical protein
VRTELQEIANLFSKSEDYALSLKRFVESSDGDYIVLIIDKIHNNYLLFNDYLGRLSLYYYYQEKKCVISKELKTILHFTPRIELNKTSIVEILMQEYPFGNKTLFQNVYRLQASQVIVIKNSENESDFIVGNSTNFNFILSNQFGTKQESIEYLKNSFIESVKVRLTTVNRYNYRIVADLSGGFDTRTILAGLSGFTNDVDYYTFEYVRDESVIAEKIFRIFGSPGRYHHLGPCVTSGTKTCEALLYETDGLVNFYTTLVCYKDLECLKRAAPQNAVRFSGLGGEFIRHPYTVYFHSIPFMVGRGWYSQISLEKACRLVRLETDTYMEELTKYFNTYQETTPEDQLKRFYYEYYHNFVCAAAEDRERIHFWTIQPLWNLRTMQAIFSQIPLHWVNFSYYRRFMDAVDPRLNSIPIFSSFINLKSSLTVRMFDFVYYVIQWLWRLVINPHLLDLYKSIRKYFRKERSDSELLQKSRSLIHLSPFAQKIFDPEKVEEFLITSESDANRLLSILMYVEEIETRYPDKIHLGEQGDDNEAFTFYKHPSRR